MIANLITLIRIIMTFFVVGLLNRNFYLNIAMFVTIIVIIMMDWFDGLIARKYEETSKFGALFDIAGDRIVENIFWMYFAAIGLISVWVPIIVVSRGFLTDLLRTMAFSKGKTPFGEKTMMESGWAKVLVSSHASRGIYAGLKVAAFCYLAGLLVIKSAITEFGISPPMNLLTLIGQILVYVVVVMCVIRGFPVIWDGRKYLLEGLNEKSSDI
ncbi:CDP-alcohol phosphatidyltransferase family protein [Candidatus Poribacteria bacterium]|nr:CDP-alcohol phosphatidyltransferase family protein [Candidatus Poribacteria bacterium]